MKMDSDGDYDSSPKSEGSKMVNKSLASKFGKPLNASEGQHTKSKTKGGGKNSSIMSNANTKSDRCGYGVNGVGK